MRGLLLGLSLLTMVAPAMAQTTRDGKPRSKLCSMGRTYVNSANPAPTVLTMSNDGGWCGDLRKTLRNNAAFGSPMHVTSPPSHGEISIHVYDDGTTVAYKPKAGFVGTDSFTVINDTLGFTVPFNVIVKGN